MSTALRNARLLDAVGDPSRFPLRSLLGLVIATGFIRVVHGGRGAYVEFSEDQAVIENTRIPRDQAWRLAPYWRKRVFYIERRTIDECRAKIYGPQLRLVDYADYRIGCWYVSPADVMVEQPSPVVEAGTFANRQQYTPPF